MSIEEDFLEVDKPIPGQNYVCLSFVSPENILKNKNIFYMQKFINNKVLIDRDNLIKLISPEEKLNENELNHRNSVINAILENKPCNDILISNVQEEYDNFLFKETTTLNKEFDIKNDFTTSTRGVKVRGTYDTIKEAQIRAKVLQRKDSNFHVFVGQVGYWLPWDPSAENIDNQEYQEPALNKLVSKYNENMENKDILYEKQIEEKKKQARKENEKKKLELKQEQTDNVNIPTEKESLQKINELRDIVDEKAKLENNSNLFSTKINLDKDSSNLLDKSINDSLNSDDPWIKHKLENVEKSDESKELSVDIEKSKELSVDIEKSKELSENIEKSTELSKNIITESSENVIIESNENAGKSSKNVIDLSENITDLSKNELKEKLHIQTQSVDIDDLSKLI
jgi:hypothetical protein